MLSLFASQTVLSFAAMRYSPTVSFTSRSTKFATKYRIGLRFIVSRVNSFVRNDNRVSQFEFFMKSKLKILS